jgi:hypothetical protein
VRGYMTALPYCNRKAWNGWSAVERGRNERSGVEDTGATVRNAEELQGV